MHRPQQFASATVLAPLVHLHVIAPVAERNYAQAFIQPLPRQQLYIEQRFQPESLSQALSSGLPLAAFSSETELFPPIPFDLSPAQANTDHVLRVPPPPHRVWRRVWGSLDPGTRPAAIDLSDARPLPHPLISQDAQAGPQARRAEIQSAAARKSIVAPL